MPRKKLKKIPKPFCCRPGKRREPERDGDIRQARSRIGYLVRIGKLKPAKSLACVWPECDYKAAEYHHHNGYGVGHHEDVIPVCKRHHSIANGEGEYIPSDEPIPD